MDDLSGLITFILFLVLLVPVVLIVMLAMLMARLNRYQDELSKSLRKVEDILHKDRTLLRKLIQPLTEPSEKTPKTETFETQSPPANQVAFEYRPKDEVVIETSSKSDGSSIKPAFTGTQDDPWNRTDRQPYEPSQYELAAKKILKEIWKWIIVGEGHRQQGASMEYAVASNWLLRIGVLILVTGIGFFLKYSIDSGLLGEQARVALTVLTGAAMITGGIRLVYGKYHLLGQGLLGGGIAVLYFSVFAAFSFYQLLAVYPSFALMILVTACAATLAIKLDSMLVAIFAIIGGYCTPIVLSTGQVNFVGLFSYMLMLGIGLLVINWYKHWHLLNFFSFFFNYALFFGAMQNYQPVNFWQVLPFLIGFFMLYSTAVFLFCLVKHTKSTLLDLLALIVNAAIFFATAYYLIEIAYGQIWVALLTVALSAFYIAHVYYCLVRQVQDRELLLSFIALAAFFVTITLPLLLSKQWVTVSWSLQALIMLWMSGKIRSAFLQQVAYLLYLIVLVRFCFIDLPVQYSMAISQEQPLGSFVLGLLKRVISFGIPIGSLAMAYKLIEKPAPAAVVACDTGNDVTLWLKDNWLMQAALVLSGGMLFIVLQLELYRSFGYLYPPLQLPVLTLIWLMASLLLFLRYLAAPGKILFRALQFFMIAVLVKLLFFDLPSWDLSLGHIADDGDIWTLCYGGAYSFQLALMRLLDFAAIIGFFVYAFRRLSASQDDAADTRQWLGGAALVLLFTFLSLEINSMLYQYVPGLRSGGVSILWSLFALALVFAGIKRRISILRMTGLALFGLVAWKVFFIDLARLEQLYRIIAFIVLGILVLVGAFAYMRYQQIFFTNASDEK